MEEKYIVVQLGNGMLKIVEDKEENYDKNDIIQTNMTLEKAKIYVRSLSVKWGVDYFEERKKIISKFS